MKQGEESIAAAVEYAWRRGRGLDPPAPRVSAEERAAAERKAMDEAFARLEREPERKAAAARFTVVKRALLNGVGGMRHGHAYSPHQREEIAQAIVTALGGEVSDFTRKAVRGAVDTAADAVRRGDKITGWAAAESAAVAIVNGDEAAGSPRRSAEPETDDPGALAALIPRM